MTDEEGRRTAEMEWAMASARTAIAALPEERRLALALVTVGGVSYREAAEILDLPLGTAMSNLKEARLGLCGPMRREGGRAEMTQVSEEILMAYADGQLGEGERMAVEDLLAADAEARQHVDCFRHSAALVRQAYAFLLNEPVPERLLRVLGWAPDDKAEEGATQASDLLQFQRRRTSRLLAAKRRTAPAH